MNSNEILFTACKNTVLKLRLLVIMATNSDYDNQSQILETLTIYLVIFFFFAFSLKITLQFNLPLKSAIFDIFLSTMVPLFLPKKMITGIKTKNLKYKNYNLLLWRFEYLQ